MNTDNTNNLLHLHSYLTMGFIQHPMFHTITDKWGCWEAELLSCLVDVTPYLQEKYDAVDDHPGVFLYEVAEPAGAAIAAWMAVNADDTTTRFPEPSEWTPLIDSLCHTFFKDLPEEHEPVYTIEHRYERNLNVVLKQDGVEI